MDVLENTHCCVKKEGLSGLTSVYNKPVCMAFSKFKPVDELNASLPPVIFLHGLGAFKEYWGNIPQKVADATKRMVYTLDMRNHGDTEWSDEFSIELTVIDLLHFLQREDISKCIVVGHSIGGATAIESAIKWPEKFEKVIVEDISVRKPPKRAVDSISSYLHLAREAIDAAPADLDEDSVKKFISDYITSQLPPKSQARRMEKGGSSDNIILNLKKENGRYKFKANLKVLEKVVGQLHFNLTGKYEGPSCFIYGRLSPFKLDREEEIINEFFPSALLEGIDNASHTVHDEFPMEFTETLLKFLL